MIVALCSVAVLLAVSSTAQGAEDILTSPCPNVFTYEPLGWEPASWTGVATLSTDTLLYSLRLDIILDNPAWRIEPLGNLGNATTQDNVEFKIENANLQIHPDEPVTVRFSVKYNYYEYYNTTPRLREIRMNGRVICKAQALHTPQSNIYPDPIYSEPDNNSTDTFNSGDRFSKILNITSECGVTAGGNKFPLIYNGKFYERGEIPWLVAIYRVVEKSLQYICGGTLVSDRHVVTAAHCMKRSSVTTPDSEIIVKLGVHQLNDWTDELTVLRKLTAATIYEEYNPYKQQNDILVLTLHKSVKFNDYIRPACLWKGEIELSRVVGSIGVVAGWGARSMQDTRGGEDEPQKLQVPIVSTTECRGSRAAFHEVTHNTTLCAGFRDGSGPCTGDSGSGLYLLQDGKWTLRGVVSLSLQNSETLTCDLNDYVVFTDAAQFLPWIWDVLAGNYVNPVRRYPLPSTETAECGLTNTITPLIHKGWVFEREQLPWLAAIYEKNKGAFRHTCAGTLLSNRHVVTAAVCMKKRSYQVPIKNIVVKLGVHNLNDWNDEITETRALQAATVHEEYNPNTLQNDIVLLTLDKAVRFNHFIRPACLWAGNTDLSLVVGKNGFVAGWGDQGVDGIGVQGEPRMVNIPIVSTETCRASNYLFQNLTDDKTLCAGDRHGSGPCKGDSGAGLYLFDGGKWRVRGVVSLSLRAEDGTNTCNLKEYIVFTDTAKYLPWIKNIMALS
ncbi:hypothetical protein PYW08_008029 [Mythimna loreyi]|uniref:Uncharacterized protein n=1 Tax=Mythimna loreyi TaxID=667449 RepID=A0ACC2QAC3_9NEOP|nr:hypothetical protein PYW08_008029 [Mythimna loreyi]